MAWAICATVWMANTAYARVPAARKKQASTAPSDAALLRTMQRTYKGRSLRASFTQTYIDAVTGPRASERGELLFDGRGRTRFAYEGAEKKVFVFDGAQAFFVDWAARQVTLIDRFAGSEAALALSLLHGGGELTALVSLRTEAPAWLSFSPHVAPTGGARWIHVLPQQKKGGFRSASLLLSPRDAQVQCVVVEDPLGNRTQYEMTERHFDVPVDATAFAADWPSGFDQLHTDAATAD